jgi:peptidoglycan/LPS O-acetylase OafA/YrhL
MRSLTYIPRFDGLRAVACTLVMIEHFSNSMFIDELGLGTIGVFVFFVLSGYLITRILLNYTDSGASKGTVAAQFFWRRFLRLAPAYYTALVVTALLGVAGMRASWWVHFLYLSNVQVAVSGHWNDASHFWSLAVEEQFYLLWFVVVVVLPERFLLPLIVGCLGLAPAYRLGVKLAGLNEITFVLLPGTIDSLATGALIAFLAVRNKLAMAETILGDGRFLILLLGVVAALSLPLGWNALFKFVFDATCINALAASLIIAAQSQREIRYLGWLSWSPLRHMGKISYGIYVYHYFMPTIARHFWPGISDYAHGSFRIVIFLVFAAASLAAAQLSWVLLEQPALKLKQSLPTGGPIAPRMPRP